MSIIDDEIETQRKGSTTVPLHRPANDIRGRLLGWGHTKSYGRGNRSRGRKRSTGVETDSCSMGLSGLG